MPFFDNMFIPFAIILILSGLLGFLIKRIFNLPTLLGYILTGIVLKIALPPDILALHRTWFHPLSEIAILILLFSIGLHFDLCRLRRMGITPLLIGILQALLLWSSVTTLGRWFPLPHGSSAWLFGACLIAASTVIVFKTLTEHQLLHARIGEKLIGILLIEDITVMFILMVFSLDPSSTMEVIPTWVLISLFAFALIGLWLVGSVFLPRLLSSLARSEKDTDLALILALGLCLASAAAAMAGHASGAVGAFLMGCILSESQHARKLAVLIKPIADVGSVVFFVGVGFALSFAPMREFLGWIFLLAICIITLKITYNLLLQFIFGNKLKDALRMAFYMGQTGEMTFIVGKLCLEKNIFSPDLYAIVCATSITTMVINPIYMKKALAFSADIENILPKRLFQTLSQYTNFIRLLEPMSWMIALEKKSLKWSQFLAFSKKIQYKLAKKYKKITSSNLSSTLSRLAPWDEYIVPIELDATSDLCGKSLRKLNLRHTFFINVVAIERQDRILVAPAPEEIFMCQDLLYVYGQEEHILAFEKACMGGIPTHGVATHNIASSMNTCVLGHLRLEADHPFVHKSLEEIALREKYACLVLAVSRGVTRIKNPQPSFAFHVHDELFVFGYASAVKVLSLLGRVSEA